MTRSNNGNVLQSFKPDINAVIFTDVHADPNSEMVGRNLNTSRKLHQSIGKTCLTISKPERVFNKSERSVAELEETNRELTRLLKEANDALLAKNQEIEELNKVAFVDGLTDCYNRNYFERFLKEFEPNGRHNNVGFVYVDLNNLKIVNDTQGHKKGDELIIGLADFLKSSFRANDDEVARIGGDEFVVICRNFENNPNFQDDLQSKVEKISKNDATPDASWGVATYDPEIDSRVEDTIHRADRIMQTNKDNRKLEQRQTNSGRDSNIIKLKPHDPINNGSTITRIAR